MDIHETSSDVADTPVHTEEIAASERQTGRPATHHQRGLQRTGFMAVSLGVAIGASRIALAYLVGLMTQGTIAPGPFVSAFPGSLSEFEHWDSGWLIGIAQHGYSTAQATAFYPGYPLAGVSWLDKYWDFEDSQKYFQIRL